jgi:urea transport system permease protein
MTQALTYAGMLLFFRNETGFGGNNGFTGFTTLLGFPSPPPPRGPRCLWPRFCCCC